MLRFTAPHEVWLDGEKYDAAEHEIAKPLKRLERHAAAAHAAGAITVTFGLDTRHVQSQEAGEAALAKAMGDCDPVTGEWDGPWAVANRELHALEQAQKAELET